MNGTMLFFAKYLGFFSKKIINSLSPQINEILPKPKLDFDDQTLVRSLTLLRVLSNFLTLVRDFSYSHDQDHAHVHSQIASISIHSQNKTPSSIMTLSPRLPSRIWAIQKEIKMHTQRRYATCPHGMSKKEKRKIVHIQGK